MSGNLFSAFRRSVSDSTRPFIHRLDGSVISYGEMVETSGRMARRLIDLGVQPGDRVAVQVEKSAEALLLYLGCLRAGAAYLPLNTAYTPQEISYFLQDSEPRIVVCAPGQEAAMAAIAGPARVETLGADGQSGSLLTGLGPESDFDDVAVSSSDLAAILYTSGTTGRSKGAMLSHGNLGSNASVLKDVWRVSDRDVLLHALPIFHTHGLFVATNTVLAAGASMILSPKFDPDVFFASLPRATLFMGVPTFYVRLLQDERLTHAATAGTRLFISGSAPLLAETHRAWLQATGHVILERYGMTETNMNTSNPYDGDRIAGTVGFPLPGTELRIADSETGAVMPAEDTGVIEVRGPNVFSGYWRMPEKTAAEFRPDGFFITGDLGKIDARGYVHIVGRAKDLIISGGFNVYPSEVEAEIDALDGVAESAVIGLPHADFGEGVTAVVVPTGDGPPDEASILAALRGRLANYKIPKRVMFAPDLPRNAMGKVQKALLREQHADLYERETTPRPRGE